MNRSGTALLYNCSGPAFSVMKQCLAKLHILMRAVPPEKYHVPLGQLAAGRGEPGEPGETFSTPVVVFCGMGGELVHQVALVVRRANPPAELMMAVLTETNAEWDSLKLYENLRSEREAIEAAKHDR